MVDDFRKQSQGTILKFLQLVGSNPQIYVKHMVGLGPLIKDLDVYLLANEEEIVIVMIDPAGGRRYELADEMPFGKYIPQYFTEDDKRDSPVWQLALTCELLRHWMLRLSKHIPHVWGQLILGSKVVNTEDVQSYWESLNVGVIDHAEIPQTFSLPDHAVHDCPMAFPLEFFYSAEFTLEDIEAARHSLQQFFMDEPEEQESAEDDDSDDSDDFDPSSLFDLDDDDELGTGSAPDGFPEGIVQQNNNYQVKVQVLKPLSNPREELNKMVGCGEIKKRMDELVNMTRYNRLKSHLDPGGKQHTLSQHCVFLGRPGTGKSTVARILGSLLVEAGVLSKGHVVVCNRGTFVGTNWGDEERSVNQVIEMSRGGVLMIDEAYLLATPHPNDPGKLVIQLLMDLLADESNRDLAVVICGYKEEMLNLLSLNSGLDSRFPNRFEFADFSVNELLEISRRRVSEYDYHFTPAALQKLRQVVTDAYLNRDKRTWGNARYIANLLEKIYCRHANRCMGMKNVSRTRVLSLTPADIVPLETQPNEPVSEPDPQPSRIKVAGFRRY